VAASRPHGRYPTHSAERGRPRKRIARVDPDEYRRRLLAERHAINEHLQEEIETAPKPIDDDSDDLE
jgi:hypothetical protein